MVRRRQFLAQTLAATTLAALQPALAVTSRPDNWYQAFQQALDKNPWLLGFATAKHERLETSQLQLQGKLPKDLVGTFYRNGPACHDRAGERYHHWFDGDGMVQAFRFDGNDVSHLGRFVETAKRRSEQQAGQFVNFSFGTIPQYVQPPRNPDAVNAANTNAVPHAGRLLALWEGGSAHVLDPNTLDTQSSPHSWHDDLQGVPFSAHPKIEADGTMWNFGHATSQAKLILYKITAAGKLDKFHIVQLPYAAMLHDFAISERHLIFVLPPLIHEPERLGRVSFLDSHRWQPQQGLKILTISKDDFTQQRWYEAPAGFLFHLGNAWEDKAGTIRCDLCLSPDASGVFNTLRNVMRGESHPYSVKSVMLTLDPGKNSAKLDPLDELTTEFPQVDPRFIGRRNRQLYSVARTGESATFGLGFNTVLRRDMETGASDRYTAPTGVFLEEHILVPKPGSTKEGDAWLIGTMLDWHAGVSRVQVLEAENLAAGPIAVATLPYSLPLGFHGNFQKA